MVFSSLIFLSVFLPIFLGIYYISPNKLKNLVLFLGSLVFYSWGEPVYFILMIFSTVVDYTIGIIMDKYYNNKNIRKIMLLCSVVVNLSLLGFFKYSDFLIGHVNDWFGTQIQFLNLALPIGISFYTFQTMSYSIDLYKGKTKVQKNIISFGAYVSMFPQLIAGPIVQYKDVDEALNNRVVTWESFDYGIKRLIEGLCKKVLLANGIGQVWAIVSAKDIDTVPVIMAWLGIISYSLQLYFDFSGYSDMAIGLGSMMGFKFPENFNYPYISKSVSEFWRRWHITLGSWFREYVYIPLGGNRVGPVRFAINIFAVWFLTGLWHGACDNFILWGIYFGVVLYIEKMFMSKVLSKVPSIIARLYTILIVIISWVIFALEDMNHIFAYIKNLFGISVNSQLYNTESLYLLSNYGILLTVCIIFATPIVKKYFDKYINENIKTIIYLLLFIICIAYLVDSTFNPFLYFRF